MSSASSASSARSFFDDTRRVCFGFSIRYVRLAVADSKTAVISRRQTNITVNSEEQKLLDMTAVAVYVEAQKMPEEFEPLTVAPRNGLTIMFVLALQS